MITVLVIDDEPIIRELVDVSLSQHGFQVMLCADGAAGLDVLRRTRIDLVLLDIHMPRFSGFDMLRSIRQMGRTSPPVLMVTADRRPEVVEQAAKLGCSGYVAKPFLPADLVTRVKRAVAGDNRGVANSLLI